jgi:hypothetical protein
MREHNYRSKIGVVAGQISLDFWDLRWCRNPWKLISGEDVSETIGGLIHNDNPILLDLREIDRRFGTCLQGFYIWCTYINSSLKMERLEIELNSKWKSKT